MPEGRQDWERARRAYEENGITRREFDAVIGPIRDDVKEIRLDIARMGDKMATGGDMRRLEDKVSIGSGQWTTANAEFMIRQRALEKQVIFAQGAIAVVLFLLGAGALTAIGILILQR